MSGRWVVGQGSWRAGRDRVVKRANRRNACMLSWKDRSGQAKGEEACESDEVADEMHDGGDEVLRGSEVVWGFFVLLFVEVN